MNNKAIAQYLLRYAEPEAKLSASALATLPKHNYQHVLIIPAYKESTAFLGQLITSPCFSEEVLLILVINQPDNASTADQQQALLHQHIVKRSQTLWQHQNLEWLKPRKRVGDEQPEKCGHILVVDRYHTPIPHKQGVGLARKIGADIALALINMGIVKSEWIASSDADATLPDNYFSALTSLPNDTAGACFAFEHIGGDPETNAATLIYQQALNYYVAGLKYAGSPYAFHTIGSTLAFTAQAYAGVRGFPKRAAGEDFHLLNKLAKTGPIKTIEHATIQLEARISERVPFGTGASTAKIMQLTQEGEPYLYYHPSVFTALREVLAHFEQLWEQQNNFSAWLEELQPHSAEVLRTLKLEVFLETLSTQNLQKAQFSTQLNTWFDALKTLRFIHGMRDRCYPNLPLDSAIAMACFPIIPTAKTGEN